MAKLRSSLYLTARATLKPGTRQVAYQQVPWPRSPRTAAFGGRFALHASALALRGAAELF